MLSRYEIDQGFSLVELLVSLLIGLVILLTLYVVLMGSIVSVSTTEGQSALVDNGRRGTIFIRQMLQQAGYRPFSQTVSGFGFRSDPTWATTHQTVYVEQNSAASGGLSDSIRVRFWGAENGLVVDCSGSPVASTDTIEILIEVSDNKLWCTDNVGTPPQIVAQEIESLQVRYSLLNENEYINNLDVTDNRWERINRIEFALLSRSSELTAGGPLNSQTYQVLEEVIVAPGDRYMRAVSQESVFVRNLIMSGRP